MLAITVKVPDHRKFEAVCLKQATDRAIQRSVSKVSITTRAEWARLIHKEIYLSIGQIKSAITLQRSHTQDNIIVDSTTVFLTSRKRRRSLSMKYFTPKQNRTGVSVSIKRSEGRKNIPHAFMWRSHVWRRAESGQGGLVNRLPIEKKYTTAVEDVAADTLPEIERFAQKRMDLVFPKQLQYELSKC